MGFNCGRADLDEIPGKPLTRFNGSSRIEGEAKRIIHIVVIDLGEDGARKLGARELVPWTEQRFLWA